MVQAASIEECALLVSLNISQWQARKRDKKATREVVAANDASQEAGNFNKCLLRRDTLLGITQTVSAARGIHERMTLSWKDNGDRMLPAELFEKYSGAMQDVRIKFEAAVREFKSQYPQFVQQARQELGKMYDPEDYPPDVSDKFAFKVEVTSLPRTEDFRVSLSQAHTDRIKEEMSRSYEERQKRLVAECFSRARDAVKRISERCGAEDSKIYDSLMGNARELVELLPALNIMNDPALTALTQEIDALLVPTNRLKQDKGLRKITAGKADDLLARMEWA